MVGGAFILRHYPGISKSRLRKNMNNLGVAIKRHKLELVISRKEIFQDERVQLKTESRLMVSVGLTFYHSGVCTVTLNHLF